MKTKDTRVISVANYENRLLSGGFGIPLLPALKAFLEPEQYAAGNIIDNVFLLGGGVL